MPSLHVVFDSNLYRRLSSEELRRVMAAEAKLSIQGIGSKYVALEMLAHLADPTDTAFASSYNALKRLWEHTKTYNGSQYSTGLAALADEQLAYVLFEIRSSGDDLAMSLGGVIGEIVNMPAKDIATRFDDFLRATKAWVADTEAKFSKSLFESVVLTIAPSATDWYSVTKDSDLRQKFIKYLMSPNGIDHVGEAFVRRVSDDLGIALSDQEVSRLVGVTRQVFPLPLHLYNRLILTIVQRGPDMSKKERANTIWDLHIGFSVGTGADTDGAGRLLVSDDKEILEAAVAANVRNNVRSFAEYDEILELDWTAYRSIAW